MYGIAAFNQFLTLLTVLGSAGVQFFLTEMEIFMAEIQILSPQELQEREQKQKGRPGRQRSAERTRIIEEYAAQELNLVLDFRPIKNPSRLHFRVITPEAAAHKPRRGGRPRKSAGAGAPPAA